MKKKARMGRPPKREADRQDQRLSVSLTPAEAKRLTQAAKREGLSKSAFLIKCFREMEGF